jgi:hypothetical protein
MFSGIIWREMNFLVATEDISRAEKRSAHSQSMSGLAQRRELREAEKPEGVLLDRFTFQRIGRAKLAAMCG